MKGMNPHYDQDIPVATEVTFLDPADHAHTHAHAQTPNPPPTAPSAPLAASSAPVLGMQNEGGAREFLCEAHWPQALQDAFLLDAAKVPLRFFICDDSGSMSANDGKRLVNAAGRTRFVPCSRWSELTAALRFHVGLAHHALLPAEFRLLNAAGPIRVGFDPAESAANVTLLTRLFEDSPNGGTPLCGHVREVVREVQRLAPQLRAQGQKACLVICTDGESSDGDVAEALRPLKDLPCWVVLRLCTDEQRVVDYWNNVDSVLELNVDVLDDLSGEAQEVRKVNPWLTYSEALQRMREWGVSIKELDLLDEKLLPIEQMRKVCRLLYGPQIDALPMPELDLGGFAKGLEQLNQREGGVWSPAEGVLRHHVESSALKSAYGAGSACVLC